MPQSPSIDVAVDAVVLFHAGEQRGIFLGALLAGDDAPVRAAAVDVLPHLLGEFRLRAELREHAGVGRHRAHHAIVGRFRNAALERARAKALDPTAKAALARRSAGAPKARLAAAPKRQARRLSRGGNAAAERWEIRGMRHCSGWRHRDNQAAPTIARHPWVLLCGAGDADAACAVPARRRRRLWPAARAWRRRRQSGPGAGSPRLVGDRRRRLAGQDFACRGRRSAAHRPQPVSCRG